MNSKRVKICGCASASVCERRGSVEARDVTGACLPRLRRTVSWLRNVGKYYVISAGRFSGRAVYRGKQEGKCISEGKTLTHGRDTNEG